MAEQNIDHLAEWTAQDDNTPAPPEQTGPQHFLPEQLPEDLHEDVRAIVEENYLTDDPDQIDPPGGILVNRETLTEEQAAAAEEPTGEEVTDLNDMTKADLQAYADEHNIEGVDMNSQNKADMITAIQAGGG
jgi:hypothetical protein